MMYGNRWHVEDVVLVWPCSLSDSGCVILCSLSALMRAGGETTLDKAMMVLHGAHEHVEMHFQTISIPHFALAQVL